MLILGKSSITCSPSTSLLERVSEAALSPVAKLCFEGEFTTGKRLSDFGETALPPGAGYPESIGQLDLLNILANRTFPTDQSVKIIFHARKLVFRRC